MPDHDIREAVLLTAADSRAVRAFIWHQPSRRGTWRGMLDGGAPGAAVH